MNKKFVNSFFVSVFCLFCRFAKIDERPVHLFFIVTVVPKVIPTVNMGCVQYNPRFSSPGNKTRIPFIIVHW